jgi:dolichyl-phosphate-mannose--protein O-mannosyl transferase
VPQPPTGPLGLGLALGLRLGLGPWGPLHVNGHMARFIEGPLRHPAEIAAYGPGFAELFGPIAWLAPANPDWAIFAGNAVLSALMAPLAYAIARLVGLNRVAAGAAGLLLAIDPVAIRGGATESYFPIIMFLATAAAVLLLIAFRCFTTAPLLRPQSRRRSGSPVIPLCDN